jgi:hypothetical protein
VAQQEGGGAGAAPAGSPESSSEGADSGHPTGAAQSREFVQVYIKRHPIWRSAAFWSECFYRGVREEAGKLLGLRADGAGRTAGAASSSLVALDEDAGATESAASAGTRDTDGAGGAAGVPSARAAQRQTVTSPAPPAMQPYSQEWGYAYAQTVFSQLGSYAMNMGSFGAWRGRAPAIAPLQCVGCLRTR